MKSVLNKLTIALMAFFATIIVCSASAYADNASVSLAETTGTKGEIVGVQVTVNADVNANGQVSIQYDSNYMDFVSITYTDAAGNPVVDKGSGVSGIAIWNVPELTAGRPMSVNFNFGLKTAGSTELKVADSTQLKAAGESNPENAELNITKTNTVLHINEANKISNDSKLSGLIVSSVSQNGQTNNVTYSPAFSPDVYEYAADVPANINRIIVSTTLSDSHASASVSGSRIDLGNNKTTITVTAQDGSQSTYTVYTQRLPEGANQNETQAAPSGEVVTDASGETQAPEFDRSPVLVEGMGKYIIQDFSLATIPEGFEEKTTNYNGRTIACLKGNIKPLTLICIADDPQGTNIEFYTYNETSGGINKMINMSCNQNIYTLIPTDDTYVGPEGYMQTAIEINGDVIKAWIKKEGTEFYVVYAMNWNGEQALYVYDTKEQTMQRFIDGNKSDNAGDEPTENEQYNLLKKQYNDLNTDYNKVQDKHKVTLVLFLVIVVAFAVVLFFVIKNKLKKDGKPSFQDAETLKEVDLTEDNTEKSEEAVKIQNQESAEAKGVPDSRFEIEEVDKTDDTQEEDTSSVWNEDDLNTQDLRLVQEKLKQLNAEVQTDAKVEEPRDDFEIEFVDMDDDN